MLPEQRLERGHGRTGRQGTVLRAAGRSGSPCRNGPTIRRTVEGLAALVGIPLLDDADLTALRRPVAQMDEAVKARDYETWNKPHLEFHQLIISRSGARTVAVAHQLISQMAARVGGPPGTLVRMIRLG